MAAMQGLHPFPHSDGQTNVPGTRIAAGKPRRRPVAEAPQAPVAQSRAGPSRQRPRGSRSTAPCSIAAGPHRASTGCAVISRASRARARCAAAWAMRRAGKPAAASDGKSARMRLLAKRTSLFIGSSSQACFFAGRGKSRKDERDAASSGRANRPEVWMVFRGKRRTAAASRPAHPGRCRGRRSDQGRFLPDRLRVCTPDTAPPGCDGASALALSRA